MNALSKKSLIACGAIAALTVSQVVSAAPIFFFGEDMAGGSLPAPNATAAQTSFLGNLSGVAVEDFESFTPGDVFPIVATFGADTATLNGTTVVSNTGINNSPLAGRFATSGNNYLNLGSTDALSFNLSFSAPQAAFGFFATDIGDFDGQLTLSFDGATPINVPHTIGAPNGSAFFWGIIDTANPFSTVQFSNTLDASDAFGFDDFTIGRPEQVTTGPGAVPLPSTLALIVLGLAGAARRRQ